MKFTATALITATVLAEVPSWGNIGAVVAGGSGCKQGTVAAVLAKDFQSFTLIFDDFIATSGPNVPFKESRKNCEIVVNLQYPSGWSYNIFQLETRGAAVLPNHVDAIISSTIQFDGTNGQTSTALTLSGPFDSKYKLKQSLNVQDYWTKCGSVVQANISTELRLKGPTVENALLTVDRIDGKVYQTYATKWHKC